MESRARAVALIVEDDPLVNEFLVRGLSAGYDTSSAVDGVQGITLAEQIRPDVIVADLEMPRLSGLGLVEAIRTRSSLSAVPVLILTAHGDARTRVQLLRSGAQDFVTKPFLMEEVLARVQNLVEAKQVRDVLSAELQDREETLLARAKKIIHQQADLRTACEQMQVARELAEGASQTKSNFLRMMSHELRTPVTAMQLYLNLLDRSAGYEDLPADIRTGLSRIESCCKRLCNLVDSALEYARIESGRFRLRIDQFDLAELAANAIAELQPHADQKGLELHLACEPGLPPISSDKQLSRLIAVNLLGNAVSFSPRGRVDMEVAHDESYHRLVVIDSGPGIKAEFLGELMEPLRQLGDLRDKEGFGSGLGLAIVKDMVHALGGKISVAPSVGPRTRYSVTLPSSPNHAALQ